MVLVRICIVDENELEARELAEALGEHGCESVEFCAGPRELEELLVRRPSDAVFLEAAMTRGSGEELLLRLGEITPHVPKVVVTSETDVETAVRCMRAGADDYLLKPPEAERLETTLRRIRALQEYRNAHAEQIPGTPAAGRAATRPTPARAEAFAGLLTQDARMLEALARVEDVAPTTHPMLLEGESGTGKELVARGLHALSGRQGAFVPVSLSGLRAEEAAEVLFGMQDSQASASASAERLTLGGACAAAVNGTLFLEELAEVDVALQGALLEMALSSERQDVPPVRLVVGTAHDFSAERQAARVRPDLYFRLQACRVSLPPLRERPADIPLLLKHFLHEASDAYDKDPPTPPQELVALLAAYHFPGNVRELRAMVHDSVAKHRSRKLSMLAFKQHIDRHRTLGAQAQQDSETSAASPSLAPVPTTRVVFPPRLPTLKETANQLIDEAMRRASGKQSIAASMLGISQSALSRRLKNRAGHFLETLDEHETERDA